MGIRIAIEKSVDNLLQAVGHDAEEKLSTFHTQSLRSFSDQLAHVKIAISI